MAPEWLSIRVIVPADERPRALDALFAAGALAVIEEDDAISSSFPPGTDGAAVEAAVRRAAPGATVTAERLPPVDWAVEWKKGLAAHRVGELIVAPPWLAEGHDPDALIVIEPAMAFGTGDHASTRGALRLMERTVHLGDRVADLGSGSGVLAIAAVKLGASRVAAIENDPQAIGTLEANLARNGVSAHVRAIEGDAATLLPLVAPVDLILANIAAPVITDLLPVFEASLSPRGRAVIAGVLLEERDALRERLRSRGWSVASEDIEDLWWSARIAPAVAGTPGLPAFPSSRAVA